MLALAISLIPAYTAWPSFIGRGQTAISTRFPFDGASPSYPASGTTGLAGLITPERSPLAAAAWGASFAAWVYTELAPIRGFASSAAFISEFAALGIPVQATTNASAVDPTLGPFSQDLAGVNFSANTVSNRPALISGLPQVPVTARITSGITQAPVNDPTNTKTPKLAIIASQVAAGASALQMDDPRGPPSLGGFRAHRPDFDLASQASDFSATALAGFPAWLAANTTSAERVAVGLPSDPTGFNLKTWLIANKASILYGAGQVDAAAIDAYLFRVSVSADESLRTIYLTWYQRYMREDQAAYVQQVRATAGVPLSLNLYAATAQDYQTWSCRGSNAALWDFAISEVPPPYKSQLGGHAGGSANWQAARWAQCGEGYSQLALSDHIGLLTLCENKPSTPNQQPARVVKQLMRQSIMQTVMLGHSPMPPIDVYLNWAASDPRDQGTDVDGYRWWGPRADYLDLFQFIRASAAYLDGYEKLAVVRVALCNDSYPFREGGSAARYDRYAARWGQLFAADVPVHLMTVGLPTGTLPEVPPVLSAAAAPLVLRLQDDGDYMAYLGRLSGSNVRVWSDAAVAEAARLNPVSSSNPLVRVQARYNPTTSRVSVHVHNYAVNADGTPAPQTTTVRWNWGSAAPQAVVLQPGSAQVAVAMNRQAAQITLSEYAIVNFAVTL